MNSSPELTLERRILTKVGKLTCKIVSPSMDPLIRVNDTVTIEPVADVTSLRRFDLLVFELQGRLTCHFLWHRTGSQFLTRNLRDVYNNDLPISTRAILGRVVDRRIPVAKRLAIVIGNLMRNTS